MYSNTEAVARSPTSLCMPSSLPPGRCIQGRVLWRLKIGRCAGGYSGFPVDSYAECVKADGFQHVLCAAWKGDNAGPHTIKEVTCRH